MQVGKIVNFQTFNNNYTANVANLINTDKNQ